MAAEFGDMLSLMNASRNGAGLPLEDGVKLERTIAEACFMMEQVATEAGRIVAVSKAQEISALRKRAMGADPPGPFATPENVALLGDTIARIDTARVLFRTAARQVADVRHGIAKRETEWRADKALRKRHRKHCAGRKNDCSCEDGCDKPEAAKCVDVIPKKQQKTED